MAPGITLFEGLEGNQYHKSKVHVKANRKSIIVIRAFLRKHSLCRGLRSRGFLSRMTVWTFLFFCTDLVWQRF